MGSLRAAVDAVAARTAFCGAVRFDRTGETEVCEAYGLADRSHGAPNTVQTLFATASGSKTLTVLAVMSLVERGTLGLGTTARSLLGAGLPLVADDVTVEHLLAHRSGIGDYLDEEALDGIADYVMPVSVHELATTERFLPLLEGHPAVSAAGADELPGRAARGDLSLDGPRTNVLHLPALGNGDGGSTPPSPISPRSGTRSSPGGSSRLSGSPRMVRPHSDWPAESRRYGLEFHVHATGDAVWLEGDDAGVSFASLHEPSSSTTRRLQLVGRCLADDQAAPRPARRLSPATHEVGGSTIGAR